MESVTYHSRVSQARARFALSQSDMAERTGISLRAYQNYERGEREIPVVLVHRLFTEFGIDPVWLLTGQGEMLWEKCHAQVAPEFSDRIVKTIEDAVFAALRSDNRTLENAAQG